VKVNAVAVAGAYMLPTAFTPNNDGHNDLFGVRGWAGIIELQLSVYDRWGNLVFHTTNPSVAWDGTSNGRPMKEGTYVYHVAASTFCGRIEQKGTVVLIR
jgi:gliding motility-associated-like protein